MLLQCTVGGENSCVTRCVDRIEKKKKKPTLLSPKSEIFQGKKALVQEVTIHCSFTHLSLPLNSSEGP